ncbi:DNA alkylation repair protein [Candidatus Saccharibacteria bacterium]|nr:DNA alkylation repair protein [Candidatus Saccharibacteria bacterium]
MYSEFRSKLISLADEQYREFTKKSILSDRPYLGVRIPDIRNLVKTIPKEKLTEFIAQKPEAVEEIIAHGFAIAKLSYEEMLQVFDSHVKTFDNWCVVDTFCAALRKTVKKHESDFFGRKVEPLLASTNEYAVRTGLVCLLDFYVQPDYLSTIFDRIESLKDREEYYIRMAIAWLLAECFIKFPDETLAYMKVSKLNKWAFNKTICKICESYRVNPDTKKQIKLLRKAK